MPCQRPEWNIRIKEKRRGQMGTMWFTASYVAEKVRGRLRAVFGDERGALSLEWIVIAVALVAAGAIAAALFNAAIRTEAGNLP
jgi:hypothetical protein